MKSRDLIDIKCQNLFPFQYHLIGYVLLMAALAAIGKSWILVFILFIMGMFIITSYNGTQVLLKEKKYREYHSYLFLKTGAFKRFSGIEKIFINSNLVSQKMYTAHTLNSSTFTDQEYNAYLKLDSGEKVLLLFGKDREKLIKNILPIADQLETSLVDTTE